MKHFILFSLPILLVSFSPLLAEKATDGNKEANSTSFLNPQNGDTVVFLGDSITHQCLYTQYIENFFYTRYPERRIRFHNAGVSGDKAADALARFDDDVAALEPDFVTLLLGMNDGQYEPFSAETFATYKNGMLVIASKVEESSAELVMLSPTMFDHHQLSLRKSDPDFRFGNREFDADYNALMAFYGAWVRETANRKQLPFVNLWGPLNDLSSASRRSDPDFSLVEDAIHPGAAGQFVMAYSVIAASQPERRLVSSIAISKRGNGKWIAGRAETITELETSDEAVSFTHLAKALPWIIPEESSIYDLKWGESTPASVGYQLTAAGHKLSQERLKISGLAPGTYELSIDGVVIGQFPHSQLAAKVELQKYAETPQYQQALKVALLNRTRNDDTIRPMRDVWAKVKGLRRRNKPESFEEEYQKLKAQIDGLHKKAAMYEEQIYEAAQPVPRKYVLTRVK